MTAIKIRYVHVSLALLVLYCFQFCVMIICLVFSSLVKTSFSLPISVPPKRAQRRHSLRDGMDSAEHLFIHIAFSVIVSAIQFACICVFFSFGGPLRPGRGDSSAAHRNAGGVRGWLVEWMKNGKPNRRASGSTCEENRSPSDAEQWKALSILVTLHFLL